MPFLRDRKKMPRSRRLEESAKRKGLRHAIFNILGERYTGEWKNDVKTGKGVILTRHKEVYEGDVWEGYRHGFGVWAYQKPNKIFMLEYRGNWWKGKMHGFGLRRFRNGDVFIGYWRYGKREGYGLMWYHNGDFYAGDWVKDMRQGLGLLAHPNNNRYEGTWLADMKHGRGKYLHLATGQLQRGVWVKDVAVFSTFHDIKYRQSSVWPTKYPIHKIELVDMEALCTEREMKALEEVVNSSCLSIHKSISEEISSAGS